MPKTITRQTVSTDPANFELVALKVGTETRKVTVQVVLPKTVEGCRMLLSDGQLVADVRRAFRIRYQEDTGARGIVRDAPANVKDDVLTKQVQDVTDGWDRHSAISRAQPKQLLLAEKPKDMTELLAILAASGINVTIAKQ